MVVIAKELLQYEKDYIKYYINFPKIYYKQDNDKDYIKNEMIESVNQIIFEDIMTFMDVVEDTYNVNSEEYTHINSITEFQVGYLSNDIISLAIEFSQLAGFYDISYLKGYNFDFKLKKNISLKHLFKENVDYIKILKKYILIQAKILISELQKYNEDNLYKIVEENICLDEENIFYFTQEYLILPFSSCEIDKEVLNLIEFKIPFNKIYNYLSDYAIKNIVKKIVL
ncbi:MAG TPA: hypothetical protein DDY58_02720 [Terrisporobacter glycolicus]|uniref:DUF3298 domain-containing protein n=1 Tax=Terrisporobacter petrolearius TaxID=1460447 RepID=A0ABZ3FCP7_9FIRM|nr:MULTISPECIES: hypothetical protein [Terrisporobacter]MBN9647358.1 hypothetical protein [Terrisporobacter glycolicus]UPA31520.1 hypothetical protein L0P85_05120 [Terrisporobacter glycolicus]HBI91426.1 hypothetical protein [Terrisporobacter hibernicus]